MGSATSSAPTSEQERRLPGNDRITIAYGYGAGARLASITDAAGFVHNFGYDTAGQVVEESYTRLKSDGSPA